MTKKFIVLFVLVFCLFLTKNSYGQYRGRYQSRVGYYPVVTWVPYGTHMSVGPVYVSPDRRYVRFGINYTFSRYQGYHTYNFYNSRSRYYPQYRGQRPKRK